MAPRNSFGVWNNFSTNKDQTSNSSQSANTFDKFSGFDSFKIDNNKTGSPSISQKEKDSNNEISFAANNFVNRSNSVEETKKSRVSSPNKLDESSYSIGAESEPIQTSNYIFNPQRSINSSPSHEITFARSNPDDEEIYESHQNVFEFASNNSSQIQFFSSASTLNKMQDIPEFGILQDQIEKIHFNFSKV